jgi:hypothetical protein
MTREQKWNLKVYKIDGRRKDSLCHIETITIPAMTEEEARSIAHFMMNVAMSKIHVTVTPATKIVKNLMTGNDIEIDYDTPRSCDPSTELYWTM